MAMNMAINTSKSSQAASVAARAAKNNGREGRILTSVGFFHPPSPAVQNVKFGPLISCVYVFKSVCLKHDTNFVYSVFIFNI